MKRRRMAALEDGHERLVRRRAELARERLELAREAREISRSSSRTGARPLDAPPPRRRPPWWVFVAVAIVAYLVAFGALA